MIGRSLGLVVALTVAACAPHTLDSPQTPVPTTAKVTTTSTTEGPPTPATADLPDWPPSYDGPRVGPFFPDGREHMAYIVSCVTDLGFPVSPRPDGRGFTAPAGAPPTQLTAALRACRDKAFEVGLVVPEPPMSQEYLTLIYQAYSWLDQCLRDLGVSTPDAPSLDAFLEDGLESWNPYGNLSTPNEIGVGDPDAPLPPGIAEQLRIQESCPIHLPDLFERAGIRPQELARINRARR